MSSDALFPRGPISGTPAKKIDFKKQHTDGETLFKLKKNSMKTKKRADSTNFTKYDEKIPKLFKTVPDRITTLKYKKITEGLVIAGRIREFDMKRSRLGISLPGRALAHANMDKISTPYTDQLQSLSNGTMKEEDVADLTDLFQIGDLVTAVVDSVTEKDGKYSVSVSLNPSDVNKTFKSSSLVDNMILIGAIKSIEDHGYVVDMGIKNVIAFLPKENLDKYVDEELVIGKVVRAVIMNIKRKSSKTTIIISLKNDVIATVVPETGVSHTNILPGTQLKVTIIKVLSDGLVVKPLKTAGEVTGHVSLNNLPSSWDKPSRFKPGMTLLATLLYTIPHVNIMHFSLWPQLHERNAKKQFYDGALVKNAKVVALSTDGTYFQLGPHENSPKGLVSYSQSGGKDDFNVGDQHTVRALQYDLIENLYICSMKPEVISAKVYSAYDLQVGKLIEAKVIKKTPGKGVTLEIGNITVFAPQAQLTDFPRLSQKDNVLSPICKINAVVKAKVLCKTESSCFVTLKPMLVKTPALCSYDEAKPGRCFYGTVKFMKPNGIVVSFYNYVTGFIPNSEIVPIILKDTFYVGQSIRCYVKSVDPMNGKLILTMTPNYVKGCNMGSPYRLTVIENDNGGLKVEVANTSIRGFLPIHQLSDHVMLLQPLKDNYKPGSTIKAAVAYSTDASSLPLFSLRSSVRRFFELNSNVKTVPLRLWKDGTIVPCSILEIFENGFNVQVCIPGSEHHFISKEDILGYDDEIMSSLSVNQAIIAVTSVQGDNCNLQLDRTKFYDITAVGFGIDLLIDYLISSKQVQNISPGQKMQASISKIKNKTVRIKLPSLNLRGIISRKLIKEDIKEKDSIEVTFLWQSPSNKIIHAIPTEKDTDIEEEHITRPSVKTSFRAKLVLVDNAFAIGLILEGPLKSKIAFIPVKSDLNDLSPTKLKLYSKIHIIPVLLMKKYIIGIGKKDFMNGVDKAIIKKHNQSNGKTMKGIFAQLLNNVNAIHNKRKIFLEIEVNDGTSQKSLEYGEDDENNETRKKKNDKKKSLNSDLSINNESLTNTSESNGREKQSLSAGNDEIPSKTAKRKKLSIDQSSLPELDSNEQTSKEDKRSKSGCENGELLNGVVDDSQLEISLGKSKKKCSLSQQNGLDSSSCYSISGKKEKKRKSCGDLNGGTDNQNYSSGDVEDTPKKKKKKNKSSEKSNSQDDVESRLKLQGYEGFAWSVDANDFSMSQADVNDSEDEVDETADNSDKKGRSKMTATEKRTLAKQSEQRLRRAEQLLVEAESNPQSVDHFERLVLAHPNSSMLWIKYMAMHLQETEIDKARAVAKRALQIINAREEEERLNVWTALLNLENLYGSEDGLKSTLAEAVRTNDDYQVHSKMLEIYADSKKPKSVEHQAAMMSKKFKSKLDCWLLCCRCLMRVGSLEKARSFFQRGLEALAKKDHVQFITRFALLENTFGSSDHAQTVMDHVLMTYPGRIPAWTTYVGMLTKSGRTDLARQVLQRSITQKLPVKKMKTLYKKWMDFERQHGSPANVTNVKNLAEQYVNDLTFQIGNVQ